MTTAIQVVNTTSARERNVRSVWRWVVRFNGAIVGAAPCLSLAYCTGGWSCSRERIGLAAARALHEVPL